LVGVVVGTEVEVRVGVALGRDVGVRVGVALGRDVGVRVGVTVAGVNVMTSWGGWFPWREENRIAALLSPTKTKLNVPLPVTTGRTL
jgi:hypothetical protein